MKSCRILFPLLLISALGLLMAGCSDNPTEEEIPVVLTGSLAETTIPFAGSVTVTYELTGNVETLSIMAQIFEPDGDIDSVEFPAEVSTRSIGPLTESGEYSLILRAFTIEGQLQASSPALTFTVQEEERGEK